MSSAKATRDSGFTLAEVLVTMLLLAISLVALAALQLNTIRQSTSARRSAQAGRLAQARIDLYRTSTFAMLPPALNPPAWEIEMRQDGVTQMRNVGVDPEQDGPFTVWRMVEDAAGGSQRLITVRVSWIDLTPGTEDSTDARTYRERDVIIAMQRSQ